MSQFSKSHESRVKCGWFNSWFKYGLLTGVNKLSYYTCIYHIVLYCFPQEMILLRHSSDKTERGIEQQSLGRFSKRQTTLDCYLRWYLASWANLRNRLSDFDEITAIGFVIADSVSEFLLELLTHTVPLPIILILVKLTMVQSTGTNNIGRD